MPQLKKHPVTCNDIRRHLRDYPGCRAADIASAFNVSSNLIRSYLTLDLRRGIVFSYTRPGDSGALRYKLMDRLSLLDIPAVIVAYNLLDSLGFYVETEGDGDDN